MCLIPRRLSLDENVRAKEGGTEKTGDALRHQTLAFRTYFSAKNGAPEEEAAIQLLTKDTSIILMTS